MPDNREPFSGDDVLPGLCSVRGSTSASRRIHPMLRYPMHGFAKRVDDTVARAITILQNRDDHFAKGPVSSLASPRRGQRRDQKPQ